MNAEEYQTGAYRWLNKVNGKCYVGGAYKNFQNRKQGHLNALRQNKHGNRLLQNAWNKYGEENFEWQILERCESVFETIIVCEQKWLDFYQAANKEHSYNLSPTAGSPLGYKHTSESLAKISESSKKQVHTPERREKSSKSNRGQKRSAEACEKMKLAWKYKRKRTLTEEHKKKIGNSRRGKKLNISDEQHKKRSEAHRRAWQEGKYNRIRKKFWNMKLTKDQIKFIGCSFAGVGI